MVIKFHPHLWNSLSRCFFHCTDCVQNTSQITHELFKICFFSIDIDECALHSDECTKDEICVNEPGSYYCEDPNYTDSQSEPEKECPVGFKFNAGRCDGNILFIQFFFKLILLFPDINECVFSLLCPSPKVCKNTIGSFICQGEEVKCPPGFYYKTSTESCAGILEN